MLVHLSTLLRVTRILLQGGTFATFLFLSCGSVHLGVNATGTKYVKLKFTLLEYTQEYVQGKYNKISCMLEIQSMPWTYAKSPWLL